MEDTNTGIKLVLIANIIFNRNLSLNIKNKSKKIVIIISLVTVIWSSDLKPVSAIGLSMVPTPLLKVESNYKNTHEIKVAPKVSRKLDKTTFMKYRQLPICIYMVDDKFLRISDTNKLIEKLRGGRIIEATGTLILIIII